MSALDSAGPAAYLFVFLATVIEGEAVFVGAALLAQAGHLDPVGVFAAAAAGGSAGDQIYFYALRGRLSRFLDRFPTWVARRDRLALHVATHATAMILACRFLPGLRVAIPAACALAPVSCLRFSILSLASSLAWAASIVSVIAWLGPAAVARLGVHAWWAPLLPAVAVLGVSWLVARKTTASEPAASE